MELLHTAKRLHAEGFAVIPTGDRKQGLNKGWQAQIGDNRVEPNGNFTEKRVKGVGVVTGTEYDSHYLLAIDIDCLDKDVSMAMCSYISDVVGSPISFRVGKPPKFLVPVLCDQNSRKFTSSSFGESKIEVLGQGQQFVAYGYHPDAKNKQYQWYNGELDINTLPTITLDQIKQVIAHFEQLMIEAGYEVTGPTATATDDNDDPFAGLGKSEVSIEEAREILSYIDATCDYLDWFRIGAALYHEFDGSAAAYDLWVEWSDTSDMSQGNHGEYDPDTKWATMDRDTGDKVSFRTVCAYARKAGADLSAISRKHKVKDEPTNYDSDSYQAEVEKTVVPDSLFVPLTNTFQNSDHTVYWTIEGYIEQAVVVNYYGESGVGKSYGAIDMSLSIATGEQWLGMRTKKGQVLYVAGEGHSGVNRRAYAWRSERGFPDASNFIMTNRALNLSHTKDRQLLEAYMDNLDSPQLLVIDTWGRATAGINENSSEDVQPIIEYLAHISRKYNCTVMVVHHTPKAHTNDSAGSKNIKASMDVEIAMVRREGVDGVVMECRKMKEGPIFEPVLFKFVPIQLPDNYNDEYGSVTYSAVLEASDDSSEELKGKNTKLKPRAKSVVKAFDEMMSVETPVPAPAKFMTQFGMDAPSEGFWESDLKAFFKSSYPGEDDTKDRAWREGIKDAIAKDALAIWDNIVVKL